MKVALLTENQKIVIQHMDLPTLAEDCCRIRLMNTGVCSSDIHRSHAGGAYFYPLIIGHEMAGEVIAVGERVEQFKKGDRVVIFPLLPCFKCEACFRKAYAQCHHYSYYGSRQHGGYAEYLDVKEWNLLHLPENVSYADAAAVEPLSVVVHALKRAGLLSGTSEPKKIGILGAGFLGLLMAQVLSLKAPQYEITIFDRNEFKLEIAKPYVDQAVDIKNANTETLFDVVVEATGVPSAFQRSIEIAANNGQVIWLGNIIDTLTLSKTLVSSILRKELTLLGTWNSTYVPGESDDWKDSLNLIQEGIRPSALVTQWITLDEVPETLQKLYDHKTGKQPFQFIKVMINNLEKEEV